MECFHPASPQASDKEPPIMPNVSNCTPEASVAACSQSPISYEAPGLPLDSAVQTGRRVPRDPASEAQRALSSPFLDQDQMSPYQPPADPQFPAITSRTSQPRSDHALGLEPVTIEAPLAEPYPPKGRLLPIYSLRQLQLQSHEAEHCCSEPGCEEKYKSRQELNEYEHSRKCQCLYCYKCPHCNDGSCDTPAALKRYVSSPINGPKGVH